METAAHRLEVVMTPHNIKLDNLLNEIKYAFHTQDYRKAELLASELHVFTANARQVQELTTNEKAATRMTA